MSKPEVKMIYSYYSSYHNNLTGEVYNHPYYPDGTHVCTSKVIHVHSPTKVETLNHIYLLDKPIKVE